MTKAIIGFPRVTPAFSFLDATHGGAGSFQAAYPVTNLSAPPLARVARTTDATAANTVIVATSAIRQLVGLIGLVRHNLSLTAQIRARLYADAAMTVLAYDSGLKPVWPRAYPFGTLQWGDPRWWNGTYSSDELTGTSWTWPLWIGQAVLASAVRLDIADTSNAAGFIQAGMLELAAGHELETNFSYDTQYGLELNTQGTKAQGGALYFDRRPSARVIKGAIKYASRDEALAQHFERLRQFDLDTPFLWMPRPDEPQHWLRTVFLARQEDPGLSAIATAKRDTVPFSFAEVL